MSDIRGLIIQSRLEYIENIAESNTYGQVMQKLSEPARQAIGEQVFLTNLYPFYLLNESIICLFVFFPRYAILMTTFPNFLPVSTYLWASMACSNG